MDSEIPGSSIDSLIFQLRLKAAREAITESVRTRAASRAIRAEAARILEQSRAFAINFRPSELRCEPRVPSPRKMRSLQIQARHECQHFFRLATELTEIIEHCAYTVKHSTRLTGIGKKGSIRETTDCSCPVPAASSSARSPTRAAQCSVYVHHP